VEVSRFSGFKFPWLSSVPCACFVKGWVGGSFFWVPITVNLSVKDTLLDRFHQDDTGFSQTKFLTLRYKCEKMLSRPRPNPSTALSIVLATPGALPHSHL
jgi:hypothetical protein